MTFLNLMIKMIKIIKNMGKLFQFHYKELLHFKKMKLENIIDKFISFSYCSLYVLRIVIIIVERHYSFELVEDFN